MCAARACLYACKCKLQMYVRKGDVCIRIHRSKKCDRDVDHCAKPRLIYFSKQVPAAFSKQTRFF